MTIAGTNAITELWAKVKAKFAVKGDAVKNITRDGTTFTATKADGNTFTFTQQDSDTKNTAGSTDTSSKLFLIGATSQAANPQTYSQDTAYVGTDGCLYSGGSKVLTSHQSLSGFGRFSPTPVPNRAVVSEGSSGEMQASFLRELSAYSASSTYSTGDLVTYNGEPYVCTTAISSPEAWDSSHWKNVYSVPGAVSVGGYALAFGDYSYAEGYYTEASGSYSHAEGYYTKASGPYSHAEGYSTKASGGSSHAEGNYTEASGDCAHAEGYYAKATGNRSHAEGYNTLASGAYSHAAGCYTTANHIFQTVVGKYNNYANTSSDHLFVVGNGTEANKRSNAFAIDTDGNVSCGAVNYGICYTADSEASKVAYIGMANSNYPKNGFVMKIGVTVRIRFMSSNTAASPSLNVNGLGAWPIYVNGASASSTNPLYWSAYSVLEFTYSPGCWVWTGVAYTWSNAAYTYRHPMGIYVFSSTPTVADLPVRPCFWYSTSDNALHYESGT